VLAARGSGDARRGPLGELLGAYWRPLYCFARRKGLGPADAEDAVQGFWVHLLERDFLSRLDPARGRLRAYLRTALGHHLVNAHERDRAKKRGGGVGTIAIDSEAAERALAAAPLEPDAAFDREWALVLMERALEKLRAEFATARRRAPFEAVAAFFGPDEPPSYQVAAARHGMTIPQLKSLLHRARRRFRELVEREALDTVAGRGLAEAEVRDLWQSLSR